MNILIYPTFESLKRTNEIYWSFKWKKHLKGIRILFFVTLFGVLASLQSVFIKTSTYHQNNFNQISILVFMIVCLIILMFCIRNYIHYRKAKEIFNSKIYELADNIGNQKILITNESILFESNLTQNIINWDFLKSYKIIDNCLFLSNYTDGKNFEYKIDLEILNNTDKKELLEFVSKKN